MQFLKSKIKVLSKNALCKQIATKSARQSRALFVFWGLEIVFGGLDGAAAGLGGTTVRACVQNVLCHNLKDFRLGRFIDYLIHLTDFLSFLF